MQINITKFILLGLTVALSGCATNQRFDCKLTNGVKCQSLSEIDRRVTSGEIGQDNRRKTKHTPANSLYLASAETPDNKTNLRTSEEVAQIWIAAYETKEGIYHQPKTLHTVLKPSSWVNAITEIPPKQD